MEISFVFLIAGVIIFIGFLGSLSFEKTKVSDVLILLGIGILLGPVFKLVEPESLTHFAEYFGSFALMIILFEGGMDLNINKLIKQSGPATLLLLVSFTLATLAIAAFLHYVHGWESMRSLLLGTIMGCTSAAIVIPVISRLSLREETKTLLSLESALSDVLAVVLTVSLMEFMRVEDIGIRAPFKSVASSFSVAIVSGILSGLFWLKMLEFFREQRYSYMATLAAILVVFAVVNFFGGSGPIAVLLFGVILGNRLKFVRFLKLRILISVDETIRFLHGEVAFFIRTFFFVYMGMMLTGKTAQTEYIAIGGSLALIILIGRYFSVSLVGWIFPEEKPDRLIMLSMLPRGLASAVLAAIPVAANIRGSEGFIEYTFIVIVITNALMTIGVFITEKNRLKPLENR